MHVYSLYIGWSRKQKRERGKGWKEGKLVNCGKPMEDKSNVGRSLFT